MYPLIFTTLMFRVHMHIRSWSDYNNILNVPITTRRIAMAILSIMLRFHRWWLHRYQKYDIYICGWIVSRVMHFLPYPANINKNCTYFRWCVWTILVSRKIYTMVNVELSAVGCTDKVLCSPNSLCWYMVAKMGIPALPDWESLQVACCPQRDLYHQAKQAWGIIPEIDRLAIWRKVGTAQMNKAVMRLKVVRKVIPSCIMADVRRLCPSKKSIWIYVTRTKPKLHIQAADLERNTLLWWNFT